VVKGDVKEVEEGMLRRMRVNARINFCGRKVADLKIYLFFATKQDRVGPSLQSRNSLFTSPDCVSVFSLSLDLFNSDIIFGAPLITPPPTTRSTIV
jgi:hypothetical protein